MIDEHFLTCRNVELIRYQRFDQMPREVSISRIRRGYRKTPTLIGIPVLVCRANGERRHLVEEEVEPVIVVNNNGCIRLDLVEPGMHGLICVEERLPLRILLQSARDGLAYR